MSAPSNEQRRSLVLVYFVTALALCLWGGTPVATKIAVATVDPLTTGVLRSVGAGVIAGILALLLGLPFPRKRRDRMLLLVSGVANFAIWPAMLSIGLSFTNASHAALIIALIPVCTGLLAAVLDGQRLALGWWVGSAVAVIGTFALILNRTSTVDAGATMVGDLIIVAGVVACAVGYVAGGKLSEVIGVR